MKTRVRLATPPPSGLGAIGVIEIEGQVDALLSELRVKPVAVGQVALRDVADIDHALIARWSLTSASIMPHAGPEVVRQLLAACFACGAQQWGSLSSPTAPSIADVESRMLDALAGAPSPLAVDLLLDQPARWRAWCNSAAVPREPAAFPIGARASSLRHLLAPPMVAVVGASNIGKSSLLNALARRTAAVTADAPGTTRDYVGVMLDLGGLVVRWIDTPGIQPVPSDALQAEAQGAALKILRRADLLVLAADATAPAPVEASLPLRDSPIVRLGLRSDLGPSLSPSDVSVCARSGEGISALAARIRDLLVPPAALTSTDPWPFWHAD